MKKPYPNAPLEIEPDESDIATITRLSKDLKNAVTKMTPNEVRYLVERFYQIQENRKRAGAQLRSLKAQGSPHEVLEWYSTNAAILESQVKSALNAYSQSQPVGRWLMEHSGIGPILSSGLLAYFDIKKAPTYGHFWSFAGLTTGFNCPVQWKKGEKRPWNADLKRLCYLAAECMIRAGGLKPNFYSEYYYECKAKLIERNERGEFKAAADESLKHIGKTTESYKSYVEGKLPPGHIDMRARRQMKKLFISHFWEACYWNEYQKAPPEPYPIAHLKHAHKIESPIGFTSLVKAPEQPPARASQVDESAGE